MVNSNIDTVAIHSAADERALRSAILENDWYTATSISSSLVNGSFRSGRNVVYVIVETSRRSGRVADSLVILEALPPVCFEMAFEDDIMPLLTDFSINPDLKYRLVEFLALKGVAFTARAYSVLIKAFAYANDEFMIDKTLHMSIRNGAAPDSIMLNSVLNAYIMCNNFEKSWTLFRFSLSASQRGCKEFLKFKKISSSRRPFESTLLELLSLSFRSVRINTRTLNTMLKMYRDDKRAVSDSVREVDPVSSSESSLDAALELIRIAEEGFGIASDTITINTLIDIAVSNGRLGVAEKMLRNGEIKAGVEAYTSLIAGYSSAGDLRGCFRVFDRMIEEGVSPSGVTLSAVIGACMNAGSPAKAIELLVALGADAILRNATSNAFLNQGNEVAYSEAVEGEFKCHEWTLALSALAPPMTKSVLSSIYSAYIVGLCKLVTSAIPDEDRILSHEGVSPDFLGWDYGSDIPSAAVDNISGAALPSTEECLRDAQKVLLAMEDVSIRPDAAAVNAFLRALCHPSIMRIKDALLIFRAMGASGMFPDKYTYSILFNALGRSGFVTEAMKIYRASLASDVMARRTTSSSSFTTGDARLDIVTVNSLLGALASSDDPLNAIRLYLELFDDCLSDNGGELSESSPDFKPSKVTYTILFIALGRIMSQQAGGKFSSPTPSSVALSGNCYTIPTISKAEKVLTLPLVRRIEKKRTEKSEAALTQSAFLPPDRKVAMSVNALLPEKQSPLTISRDEVIDDFVSGRSLDQLVELLYRNMRFGRLPFPSSKRNDPKPDIEEQRFEYRADNKRMAPKSKQETKVPQSSKLEAVEPDKVLVGALMTLFSQCSFYREREPSRGSSFVGKGFSKETAMLIFEDLVILGWHPRELVPVLNYCRYPDRYARELLYDENQEAVIALRQSATSARIFKKYKWNEFQSGWSPFWS